MKFALMDDKKKATGSPQGCASDLVMGMNKLAIDGKNEFESSHPIENRVSMRNEISNKECRYR